MGVRARIGDQGRLTACTQCSRGSEEALAGSAGEPGVRPARARRRGSRWPLFPPAALEKAIQRASTRGRWTREHDMEAEELATRIFRKP